jgi:hypothetical protein
MSRTRPVALLTSLLAIASVLVAGVPVAAQSPAAAGPGAAPAAPSVRLIAPNTKIKALRFKGQPIYVDLGMYIAAVDGPWQVNASRPDYDHPIQAVQVIHDSGFDALRPLPDGMVTDMTGLPNFLNVVVSKSTGEVVSEQSITFCPAGNDQRVNANGPTNPTYPRGCYAGPFALGAVWGIDRGWAVSAFGFQGLSFDGKNGTYKVHVSIGDAYRDFFAIPAAWSQADVTLRVKKDPFSCGKICPEPGPRSGGKPTTGAPVGGSGSRDLSSAPTLTSPDPSTLPDLIALPAWSIAIALDANGRDYISFAATVWNRGPAPLVVEGFREKNQALMQGWQYFYDAAGNIVGRDHVGQLHYDKRPGHQHWHFEQFAKYSLLDASKQHVVISEKEAFCLAPTDGIDMTVPGAQWNPGQTGLGTACGDASALWVREVLHTGWGDTYYQSLPGQSLDVTDLPNGVYYVAVEANPDGVLHESNYANNVELRKVRLGGVAGARTVVVKAWHGITV